MSATSDIVDKAAAIAPLMKDLAAICDTGGRLAGTESELVAREYLAGRLTEIGGKAPQRHVVEDIGWWRAGDAIERLDGKGGTLPCVSLVRSPSTPAGGLVGEVLDLGRGTEEDFKANADKIPGRIVMVRHEYMFTASTIHRRRKYNWAIDHGAAGFLIACHLPGDGMVTGSSGATPERGIPAAGISANTAAALAEGSAKIKLRIQTEERPRRTENLILDMPGKSDEWVVLSAHIDGHHLSESAMDNGTGLAAALAVAGAMAPHVGKFERGLRVGFFNVEEWALAGSARYVDEMTEAERAKIQLDVNLDSIAGSPNITALTSGYEKAEKWFQETVAAQGGRLGAYRPMMPNSDHYNFARVGIPAARFVAGFDEPSSHLRYVLTPEDNRDKVDAGELSRATAMIAGIVAEACQAKKLDLR